MKRVISLLLAVCLLAGLCSAAALEAGEARAVVGADLTQAQIETVYESFGVARGSVPELTVTNDEERTYLNGLVTEDVLGTRSISCVYIEILPAGSGLEVSTGNITWCSREMYLNALVTAGVEDARVTVAAPFAVSGTAALTGIYKAYEDISGEALDELAKLAGTQELVVTAELAEEIGNIDAVTIVNELKLLLGETKNMTDDELRAQVRAIAADYGISITDGQIDQLISLCRSLENLSTDELKAKVESVQETIKKLAGAAEKAGEVAEKAGQAVEKVSGFAQNVKRVVQQIGQFFSNLFSRFK